MLGRPGITEPVWNSIAAGSWLMASVCMLLITHTSSMTWARWCSGSLSQVPAWPWRVNLSVLGAQGNDFWPEVIVVLRSAG